MRLIGTGFAGFIGSNFVHYLVHKYNGIPSLCCPDQTRYQAEIGNPHDIYVVDKLTYASDISQIKGLGVQFSQTDICDAVSLNALFKENQPDVVVHMAAATHVDNSIESSDEFVQTNVLGTHNVLEAVRKYDGRLFVVSTDEVYGSLENGSANESYPLLPSNPYSSTKAGADLLCLAYAKTYGLPITITRCTNNYGPRQHREKFIPKVITNALNKQSIPVYGTGENVRDWIYVKDHCSAIDTLVNSSKTGIYNISAIDGRKNIDVVNLILNCLERDKSLVNFVKDRLGHDWRYSIDAGKLMSETTWTPVVSFDVGIRYTIDWYSKNGVS